MRKVKILVINVQFLSSNTFIITYESIAEWTLCRFLPGFVGEAAELVWTGF